MGLPAAICALHTSGGWVDGEPTRLSEGRLDGGRDVDRHETIGGEQTVLAPLVDSAEVPLVLGVLVHRIVDRFESMDVSRLSKLKG